MGNGSSGEPVVDPGDKESGSETELESEKKPEVEKKLGQESTEPAITDSKISIKLSSDEEKIIEELEQDVETIEPEKPSEEDKKVEEANSLEVRSIDNSKIPKDVAVLLANAIVTSIDTMQSTACRLVSQRPDCEWHFNPKDKDGLVDAWLPVTKKWGDKIPVEIIAIITTISVIGTNVGVAVASRPKAKKTKEEEKK